MARVKQIGLKLDEDDLESLREYALLDDRTIAYEIRAAIRLYVKSRRKMAAGPNGIPTLSGLTREQRAEIRKISDRGERIQKIRELVGKTTKVAAPEGPSDNDAQRVTDTNTPDRKGGSEPES
jgi:hypothetical protein